MAHRPLVRICVPVLALLATTGTAVAQIKLPRKPAEKEHREPRGDLVPHHVCLTCGNRNYATHVDGRKDEAGHDLVWCETCKRDTPQRANVNAEPGIAKGTPAQGGGLKLPKPPVQSPPTAPVSAPPPDAPPVAEGAPRALAGFVFAEVGRAKSSRDPLLDTAVESLLASGDAGLAAARAELAATDPWRLVVAMRCLLRSPLANDQELVRARMATKLPPAVAAELVDEIAGHDPVRAGPPWLASLLEHPQGVVRQAASRHLARLAPEELVEHVGRLSNDKRTDTRLAALELVANSTDARATEILLARLDDVSSRVAATAVRALALREDSGLDARLLSIAFKDRWLLRRGAYALATLLEREDLRLKPVLDATHVEPLLGALEKKDAFVAATAASALAGIGFESTDPKCGEWLDRPVMDRLVLAVSGQEYHDDLSSIVPTALRRLRMLSGQALAADGPRWVDWWIGARDGFQARRAALEIAPADVLAVIVRFESSGAEPEAFTLVGPQSASSAEKRVTTGAIYYLNSTEITDLVAVFQREGLLGAGILPGARGARGQGDRTLEILSGARAKAFTLGPDVKETWFERASEAARDLCERNRWQRYPPGGRAQDTLALWRGESEWWSGERTPIEREARLKALVFASLVDASPAQREAGIRELERLYRAPEGPSGADFEPLLALLREETVQGDRAGRVARLALAAGRKLGSDGYVPDGPALALATAYTKLFGTNAVDALAEQMQSARREFVRAIAADERPILRAVAAKTLAVEPSEEDVATLIRLLDDKDLSVETAAVAALGAHKVEAARTELLVRARVGFPAVRAAALEAIGRLGGEYVLEALIQGIHDKDRGVRIAATRGLAALGDPASAQVLIASLADVGDTDLFDAARAGLVSMGEKAWPDLLRAVNQPSGRIRREAALILSEAGHPDAVSPLISILTASPKDAHVANELVVLTCVDLRGHDEPARAWWTWWDGVRHDDAMAWFRAALERLGVAPPPPGAFDGGGSVQARAFLVAVMGRAEPWLVERARRELVRLTGHDVGPLPATGPERDAWLRGLRERIAKE